MSIFVHKSMHSFFSFHHVGVIIAMHGALALSNLLYAMPSNTTTDIEEAFAAYKAERMGPSTETFRSSQLILQIPGEGLRRTAFVVYPKIFTCLGLQFHVEEVCNEPSHRRVSGKGREQGNNSCRGVAEHREGEEGV